MLLPGIKLQRPNGANLPLERATEVGCRIPTGPLGRAGVLMVGIIGTAIAVGIIGDMPCIGPNEVNVEFIVIGVRTGIVGIMDIFVMDPIPRERFK